MTRRNEPKAFMGKFFPWVLVNRFCFAEHAAPVAVCGLEGSVSRATLSRWQAL